jgi:hypothetical protein
MGLLTYETRLIVIMSEWKSTDATTVQDILRYLTVLDEAF